MAIGNSKNNKNVHIPYRESKLTHILENYLGANCRALMFANISPTYKNQSENKSTLNFANEVNQCIPNFNILG